MKNLNDPILLLQEAFAVWRIFLLLFTSQILGGVAGLVFGRYPIWLLNFWMGAASASVFGYGLGIIWHYYSPERRTREHRETIVVFGVVVVILLAVASFLRYGHGVIQTSFRQTMP